ncbi:sodium pump decarboxylase gamma subunit family protein [Thiovulum sp. ES]|jgi:oxaloacetate decarboxylase gamma subunit|nr:sodium pump decarboxylase gamma subunit family protein [Thiovulum sp. ES]
MEGSLVSEGLKFMTLGMGTVFVFLILMIIVLNLQAYLIGKFFPEKEKPKANTQSSNGLDKQKVAAIVGAVSAYKKG